MPEAIKQYEASCVYNAKKVLTGHLAFNPSGNLVKLPPGSVRPAISLERGEYLEGLKKDWKLATPADFKKKEAEEADRAKKESAEAKKA